MRYRADTITDDELDALYAERDELERRVQDWRTAAGAGIKITSQLRGQLDDVRRAMVAAGLITEATPDSDASLAALLKQGLDAFWASMRLVDEKADRQLEELVDAGRKFKAWGEEQQAHAFRAEATVARVGAALDDAEWGGPDRHDVIAEIRAALAEPKEVS